MARASKRAAEGGKGDDTGGRTKRRRRRAADGPAEDAGESVIHRVGTEFLGLGLLGTSLLALLALATYSPSDPVFELQPVANRAGVVGATIAGWLFGAVGYGSVVVVGALAWLGGRLVLGLGVPGGRSRFWTGVVLLTISLTSLPLVLDALAPGRLGAADSGAVGGFLVEKEQLLLSSWGALLVNGMFLAVGLLAVAGISTGTALAAVGAGAAAVGVASARGLAVVWSWVQRGVAWLNARIIAVRRRIASFPDRLSDWRLARQEQREERAREAAANRPPPEPEVVDEDKDLVPARPAAADASPADDAVQEAVAPAADIPAADEPAPSSKKSKKKEGDDPEEPAIVDHLAERKAEKRPPSQETFRFTDPGPSGPFTLPDVKIFQAPPSEHRKYDRDSLLMNSRILEKKLMDFGVDGRVVRVHPGPVITMYEYEPAAGVKVNRIVNLTDDLAMALRALSIRIIAPLPGKSVVGIEVPNPDRETVYLRTLLEGDAFRNSKAALPVAMGKDIFGAGVASDMAKMPHLLVAGATGTGKSVFLNSFLCSLLCRVSPNDLKLLLIDPKMLELSIYEDIPHLIADVVTNPKRAAAALAGIVKKMEERYLMMSAVGVRNISQFNAKAEEEMAAGNETFRLKARPGEEEGQEVPWQRLPFIVVVIDELADLMVLAAKEVEESLQRLAQMARAAGIHLVLATQRPSVDVITGVIKANFPSRVSFQVSSGTDSRTILDQKGSEQLLGQGDMLFLPPGTSQLQRLHGPFVDEKEVAALCTFLREQGKPVFDEDLARYSEEAEAPTSGGGEDVDEMFDQAVAIVAETRNASISYVQRRLKIGYNRAARIIEQMENDGMVGPQIGTRPREVFLRAPDDE